MFLSPLDALIELRACEAVAEIRCMAADAIKFINRSGGQHLRRHHEQIERREQFYTVEEL